jgi:hypothetical protein
MNAFVGMPGATLALLLLGSGAGAAPAQEAGAPTKEVHLLVRVAAPPGIADTLKERLGPRLAERQVALQLTSVDAIDVEGVLGTSEEAPGSTLLARVWLDGRKPDAAVVLLVPRRADHLLARRIELKSGLDEVALAEIDFVLDRAVSSLLASQPVGVPMAEARAAVERTLAGPSTSKPAAVTPPPSAPSAVATTVASLPAPPRARLALDLAAFAGGTTVTTAWAATPIFGGSMGLTRESQRWPLGLRLDAQVRRSVELAAPGASVAVSGGVAHLSLQGGRRFGRLGVASALLGAGIAMTSVEPSVQTPAGAAVHVTPRHDYDLDVLAAAQWAVPVSGALCVLVQVALDVAPTAERYAAVIDGSEGVVVTPPLLRPVVLGGISYAFGR